MISSKKNRKDVITFVKIIFYEKSNILIFYFFGN